MVLKQAPRAWYHELLQFLVALGFSNSYTDTSLFVLNTDGTLIYLFVYVDGIIIKGNNDRATQEVINLLIKCFSLKDLGPLPSFWVFKLLHTHMVCFAVLH